MVSRSHTAMDSSTVLVGDLMDSLLSTKMEYVNQRNDQTHTNDDEGVGEEGEQHEEGHHPAIDRLDHLQGPQPGGGVNQVATTLGCTSGSKIEKQEI